MILNLEKFSLISLPGLNKNLMKFSPVSSLPITEKYFLLKLFLIFLKKWDHFSLNILPLFLNLLLFLFKKLKMSSHHSPTPIRKKEKILKRQKIIKIYLPKLLILLSKILKCYSKMIKIISLITKKSKTSLTLSLI